MENAKVIVVKNKIYRPLIDGTVTEKDWKIAEAELNETADAREAALRTLKERLANQSEFTSRTDDNFLLRFLRVRKFDVDRTFHFLREHYKFRVKYPDIFTLPSKIETALKSNVMSFLPYRDHKGRAIVVVKLGNWDPAEFPYLEFISVANLMHEYFMSNPVTQINGITNIWDTKGLSIKQFLALCSPRNVSLLANLLQDRFPARFKIAICVNCNSVTVAAWNIFKTVVREKFKKRVKLISGDMSALHEFLDPDILPEEYGGVMPPSDCSEIVQTLLNNEEQFIYDRTFGYHSVTHQIS